LSIIRLLLNSFHIEFFEVKPATGFADVIQVELNRFNGFKMKKPAMFVLNAAIKFSGAL
jgi:hypothetical protein